VLYNVAVTRAFHACPTSLLLDITLITRAYGTKLCATNKRPRGSSCIGTVTTSQRSVAYVAGMPLHVLHGPKTHLHCRTWLEWTPCVRGALKHAQLLTDGPVVARHRARADAHY
jgi:hypothetical protein